MSGEARKRARRARPPTHGAWQWVYEGRDLLAVIQERADGRVGAVSVRGPAAPRTPPRCATTGDARYASAILPATEARVSRRKINQRDGIGPMVETATNSKPLAAWRLSSFSRSVGEPRRSSTTLYSHCISFALC
jgi:hypothetical protein